MTEQMTRISFSPRDPSLDILHPYQFVCVWDVPASNEREMLLSLRRSGYFVRDSRYLPTSQTP